MTPIQIKYNEVLKQVEHILGNVNGGIKSPTQAATEIHLCYAQFIATEIRYPGEPPLFIPEETQLDREMKQHFSQADKGK